MNCKARSVGLFLILCPLSSLGGVIYIDKSVQESNLKVVKVTYEYTHDATGNSVANATFETFATISKVLIYITAKIADDKANSGVYRELVKTVIDVEKMIQGGQANPIVKQYFETITRCFNFTLKFPLPPVSNKTELNLLDRNSVIILYRELTRFSTWLSMRHF